MTHTQVRVHGNHFDNMEEQTLPMEWIGGANALSHARSLMEQLEPELPRCPFCGAPAVLESAWAYNLPAVRAVCTQCQSATALQVAGKNFLTKKVTPLAEAIVKAAQLWKRRAC